MHNASGRIDEIFWKALEITLDDERREYLDRACGNNGKLRRRLEKMLKAQPKAEPFLEEPFVVPISASDQLSAEQPGTMIGPYELIEEIGEGGMGVVFMAEQRQPIARKVALKIIKPGLATREVIGRFEAERQALALMDHLNIARVLDAGTTESGRPYFVMELVDGIRLTEYCDQNHLETRERLALFICVCQAVQHAHQKGIIHRDLKPSNVMVTHRDGTPVPKIIDFGIAKAVDRRLADKAAFTRFGQMIGTPLYMSPEQAEHNGLDVDTRSDIYSLGVLLYELLTGATPFERERFKTASYDEICSIIREEEPPRPSAKFTTLGEAAATVSSHRNTDPGKLGHLLRGELDWIVMKSLEKDRTRRYETATAFAQDVQRYLDDETVEACPPSTAYRFRKFVRRNKTALATTVVVALALVLGLAGTTWQSIRATRALHGETEAKNLARQRLREVEQQREIAEQRKEALRQSLYAADIGIVHQVWQAGNRQWALAKLEALRPQGSDVDLRGFEWHYLWRLCNSGRQMLPEHGGDVYGVTFSPDGRLLATASEDETVTVWDVARGRLVTTLSEHAGELNCVAFSPNGQLLAIGADNGTILIRETDSWALKATLAGHADNVLSVEFSPDGRLLASGAWDDKMKLWDTTSFQTKATLEGCTQDVEAVAFSPDSKTLATACWSDKTVRLWDTVTGKARMTLKGHAQQVYCVAFSHDGRLLATGSKDYTVRLWNVNSGEMLHTFSDHTEWVRGVAFSPDDRTLASCSNDTFVHFWDTTTGKLVRSIRGNSDRLRGVVYSPDGKTLATAGSHGIVRLWDATAAQEERKTLVQCNGAAAISFSQDGRRLTAVSSGDGPPFNTRFTLCDTTETELATFEQRLDTLVMAIALAPDGRTFAMGGNDGRVSICDVDAGRELVTLGKHAGSISLLAFTPDGRTLAAASIDPAGPTGHVVKLWNVAGEKEPLTFPGGCKFALAPDGKTLATVGENGSVDLWDTANGQRQRTLQGHENWVCALAFSPDGNTLASGSGDHTIGLWDPATGKPTGTMLGHADGIECLTFSPDGKTLASVSVDGTVRLWNVAARRELMILEQNYRPRELRFSPDGRSLISAGNQRAGIQKLLLWSAAPLEFTPPDTLNEAAH